jgi:hypothetical protein
MTTPPIGIPHSTGLEITLQKDGNPWKVCLTDTSTNCDGEAGHLALNGQVVGIPSKEPYYWSDVSLEAGFEANPLNGFRVGVRFYEQFSHTTTIPGVPPEIVTTYYREYPGFELISQTLEYGGELVFRTNTGNELFTAEPRIYVVDEYATAGITDGTRYSYNRVFDEASISYLPRLSLAGQMPVENGVLPDQPYDENADPPVYPIDLLTSFLPDDRDSVTVTFILTTVWDAGDGEVTTVATINHTCTQDTDFSNIAGKIKSYQKASYFGNGLPHIGLYPPPGGGDGFDLPYYNDDGDLESGVLNEPFDIRQLTRNSYPVEFETGKFRPYPESL